MARCAAVKRGTGPTHPCPVCEQVTQPRSGVLLPEKPPCGRPTGASGRGLGSEDRCRRGEGKAPKGPVSAADRGRGVVRNGWGRRFAMVRDLNPLPWQDGGVLMSGGGDAMARAEQIKALIRCHAEGDDARFYAVAIQVAAQAARTGHGAFAQELKDLVDQARSRERASSPRPIPIAQPRGELAGLLTAAYPRTRLADMALADGLRARLERVLHEQRQRELLRSHGFAPQRKLLLLGPPGTGKTMTAAALAGELGLPLFTLQLDGLITRFLGETAAKLRLVFDAIAATRGVYFFDEFDALGSQRATGQDVGEIRRVLNSFLQFLEQDDSESLVIGATNHAGLLDRALHRRFDTAIEYELPSAEVALRVMRARLALLDTHDVDWTALTVAAGLSHAELTQACAQAAKDALLNDTTVLSTAALVAALEDRRAMHP